MAKNIKLKFQKGIIQAIKKLSVYVTYITRNVYIFLNSSNLKVKEQWSKSSKEFSYKNLGHIRYIINWEWNIFENNNIARACTEPHQARFVDSDFLLPVITV